MSVVGSRLPYLGVESRLTSDSNGRAIERFSINTGGFSSSAIGASSTTAPRPATRDTSRLTSSRRGAGTQPDRTKVWLVAPR